MKARYFIVVAIICALAGIVFLRANSQNAANLRAQLLQSDTQSQDITSQLNQIKTYVFRHMNASVKFELTGSYERAVAAAKQAQAVNQSGDIYAQAQAVCGQDVGTGSVAQVKCVEDYLNQHVTPGTNPQLTTLPDRSLYNYSFSSPTWTADLAGLSLLAAILAALVALVIYIREAFAAKV